MSEQSRIVSYAQNREDVILLAFFQDVSSPGFYVDVGANHPEEDSVTKLFYDKGWNGINIEPSPKLYKILQDKRPRDINLNIGVADKDGVLKFREYQNHGLSTFSPVMMKRYMDQQEHTSPGSYTEQDVPVKRLSTVFNEYVKGKTIHLMKVDVEGVEYEVLASNNWVKYRPWVICIESNHILKNWSTLLKKAKYKKAYFDGLNDYFVAQEHRELADNFSYPDQVILGPRVIDRHTYQREKELESQSQVYASEIRRQQAAISAQEILIGQLCEEIDRQQSLKGQVKNLYKLVDSRILGAIDKRGFKVKRTLRQVAPPDLKKTDKLSLLKVSRKYDTEKYFQYKSPKAAMKFRYRVASKAYRTARDIAKKGAQGSHRLLKSKGSNGSR